VPRPALSRLMPEPDPAPRRPMRVPARCRMPVRWRMPARCRMPVRCRTPARCRMPVGWRMPARCRMPRITAQIARPRRESRRKGQPVGLTIGVDVGGTKVAAGVVDEQGKIIEKLIRSTPAASPEQTAHVIGDAVLELLGRHQVDVVGLGAAGFVDEARANVLFAPNLAWRDEPVKKKVEDRTGLSVIVENDANATAWAEAIFGAARGHQHVVLITVGTGIGGAIVINGQLYRGRWGIAGEPGHYRVVPGGRLCGCGNRGCWEQYASGNALAAAAREFAARSPAGAARLLQLGGSGPEGITGPAITQAAREGDPAALRCFETVGTWLGQGLADLAAILDPGCFVIGGGVSEAGDLLLGPARAAFRSGLTGGSHRPFAEIRLAELGPDAGLVGAADLARRRLASDLARSG
jgi:glucokinase